MSERRIVAGRLLTALAAVGVLVGHWTAYWLAVPNPTLRESILIATGHSYWMTALKIGVVAGITALVMIGLRAVSTGGGYRGRPIDAFVWASVRLASIQMTAFVGLELAERAAVGDPISQVFANHLLVVGLATQVIVAVAVALVTVVFAQIVRHVSALLRSILPQDKQPKQIFAPHDRRLRLRPGAVLLSAIRGPPLVAH